MDGPGSGGLGRGIGGQEIRGPVCLVLGSFTKFKDDEVAQDFMIML
jgi:hypothetical protein